MEDLDQTPSKFHELNNAIHGIAVTTAVIKTNLDSQREQSGRIESAVASANVRLDRFDFRMNDIEKSQLSSRSEIEREIAAVRSDMQRQAALDRDAARKQIEDLSNQVSDVATKLRESMAMLAPVKLLVYGAATLILTGVINVLITKAMITNVSQPHSMSAPVKP
jgi:septal ring factor EnvC (AmiA/AmiB activator)